MKYQGLRFIDCVVLVAIMALLIGVLVPTYQTYVLRAKVLRELERFIPIREAIKSHVDTQGNLATYIGENFRFEGNIGTVVMTLEDPDPRLHQKEVWLQTADGYNWHCGTPYTIVQSDPSLLLADGLNPKYLAAACRNTTLKSPVLGHQ